MAVSKMVSQSTVPSKLSHKRVRVYLALGLLEKSGMLESCCGNINLAGLCSLLWKFDILIFMF